MNGAIQTSDVPRKDQGETMVRYRTSIVPAATLGQFHFAGEITTKLQGFQTGESASSWRFYRPTPLVVHDVLTVPGSADGLLARPGVRSLSPAQRDMLSQIESVAEEFGQDDWDGEGAAAVSRPAVIVAQRLVRALPTDISAAQIAADPDGEISFEWRNPANDIMAVSVGAQAELYYAVHTDVGGARGRGPFYDVMPARILFELRRFVTS